MSYNSLLPLIKKTKSNLSPEEFQSVINVVFHDFEAAHYDAMHSDMRDSLQEQVDLLIQDLFIKRQFGNNNLSLLDIGCGTGLSTQAILNSELGKHIAAITLLDTSSNMLVQAEVKAKQWGKKYALVNGYLSEVSAKYDVVIICSVLHHIPNLEKFLAEVTNVLNPGGILIHLQDPNGDSINSNAYKERVKSLESATEKLQPKKKITEYIPKKWRHFINRKLGRKNYIDLVNDKLLATKAIRKRMTADEIWSVTDIHVETKTNTENKGISIQFLKKQLLDFNLINQRSYGFFGVLKSDLSSEFAATEDRLIKENDLSGRNVSAIWTKNQ